MTKFTRIIQNYLIYSLPFVIGIVIWAEIIPTIQDHQTNTVSKLFWEALSWNMMLWVASLIVYVVMLVLFSDVREKTLKRIANIKERDELEQMVTGKAARSTYLSTLSLMICLFFFSSLSINYEKLPEGGEKTGKISIGASFSLLDNQTTETKKPIIPLSTSAIILILMGCHLVAFNWNARKEHSKLS